MIKTENKKRWWWYRSGEIASQGFTRLHKVITAVSSSTEFHSMAASYTSTFLPFPQSDKCYCSIIMYGDWIERNARIDHEQIHKAISTRPIRDKEHPKTQSIEGTYTPLPPGQTHCMAVRTTLIGISKEMLVHLQRFYHQTCRRPKTLFLVYGIVFYAARQTNPRLPMY